MEQTCYTIIDGKLTLDASGNIHVFVAPNEEERRAIATKFDLDEHTITSALDPDELARAEVDTNYLAVIYKRPKSYPIDDEDDFTFTVQSVGVFLVADSLIIILPSDIPLFQNKVYAKVASLRELVLKMVFSATTHFTEHLRAVNDLSNSLEEQINTSMHNKCLYNLFTLEKSLVYYLNATNSNNGLIERLLHNANRIGFNESELELLDCLMIENNQCCKQTEIYSNILASLMDARVSIVSNNLNWLMKTLTIITIAIMSPTLVVSIFSMNVKFPGQDYPGMFWLILILAVSSILSVMLVGRVKKW